MSQRGDVHDVGSGPGRVEGDVDAVLVGQRGSDELNPSRCFGLCRDARGQATGNAEGDEHQGNLCGGETSEQAKRGGPIAVTYFAAEPRDGS